MIQLKKYILISALSLSFIAQPTIAHASRWEAVKTFFAELLNRKPVKTAKKAKAQPEKEVDLDDLSRARIEAEKSGKVLRGSKEADPFYGSDTNYLFSSIRNKDLIRTVGQEGAIDDIAMALANEGKKGFFVTGSRGTGKRQVLETVEYAYRLKSQMNPNHPSHVIVIDAASREFRDIKDFEANLRTLEKNAQASGAGEILFFIDNLDTIKLERGGAQTDFSLDEYINKLMRFGQSGSSKPKIKVALKSDEGTFSKLISSASLEKSIVRVDIKANNEVIEIQEIIERNILLLDPRDISKMTEQKLARFTEQARRFFAGQDSAAKALDAFQRAMARRAKFFADDMTPAVDEIITAQEKALKQLKEDLREVGQMKGQRAQELQKSLPNDIKQAEVSLANARKEYDFLVQSKKAIKRAEDALRRAHARGDKAAVKRAAQGLNNIRSRAHNLSERALAYEIAKMTGTKLNDILRMTGPMTFKEFSQLLDNEIIGQPTLKQALLRAAERVARAYQRNKFHAVKPIFSLFVTGDPGSGKTAGLRLLGQYVGRYAKYDGAEFKEKEAIARLIGSHPGYANNDEGGKLVNHLNENPRSVTHFDELDKADRNILDILGQYMDPGTLSSGNGITVRTNQSVLGTSSNHLRTVPKGVDTSNRAELIEAISDASQGSIKPEFLNRFDEIVYVPKNPDTANNTIFNKFLSKFNSSDFAKENFLRVEVSAKARKAILSYIRKQTQGSGRDVERLHEVLVKDPLEKAIEDGDYFDAITRKVKKLTVDRGDLVRLDYANGEFVLRAI